MSGVILVARRPPPKAGASQPHRTREPASSGLPAPRLPSVSFIALPKASAHGQAWALLDARLGLVIVLLAWSGRNLGAIRRARRQCPLLAIPGLLLVTGTLLDTTAAAHGQLSVVSVLGSLFPVFTVGLGVTVLRERLSPTQTIGVLGALAGIVLIAS